MLLLIDCHVNGLSIRDAPAKFHVPTHVLRESLNDLAAIDDVRIALGQCALTETKDQYNKFTDGRPNP
jgi:hypothetical protein